MVATGAVVAGVLVANPIFWGVAGSVFFLASAGLVAWAAKELGVLAATIDLFRVKFGGSETPGAGQISVQDPSQPPGMVSGGLPEVMPMGASSPDAPARA
jgi:hypothetical protein